jgi:hypothetical protein
VASTWLPVDTLRRSRTIESDAASDLPVQRHHFAANVRSAVA